MAAMAERRRRRAVCATEKGAVIGTEQGVLRASTRQPWRASTVYTVYGVRWGGERREAGGWILLQKGYQGLLHINDQAGAGTGRDAGCGLSRRS
jgi:hypothetical protein